MVTPLRNAENFMKEESNTTEHMDSTWKSLEKLCTLSVDDATETGMLRSRIDEQSSLICMLKQRADEVLLQCQALQKTNTELECRMTDCQKDLDDERKKSKVLEKRFMDLAANHQAIIAFMDEYKRHNVQLKLENKQLQSENESLFSHKVQEKEVLVQKLMQEINQLTEKYTHQENEFLEKIAGCQSKLLDQTNEHQANATLLLQLHDAQQLQRDAEEKCNDLKLKLRKSEEVFALKEMNLNESITSLTKEKDKLLQVSMERGKVLQEKQEKIQQLETKLKEEKKARAKAEDRFEQEAEVVKADAKVMSLQSALDGSMTKYGKLKKEFEAFQEHSTNLLIQERELNKKLRHMLG